MAADDLDFTSTLAMLRPQAGGYGAVLAPNWVQGRAGFGGLVAALGMEAIRRHLGTDWPLRSLTVAFVGPAVGDLDIQVAPLRVGRSAAFVQAVLRTGEEVGATITACLGPDRESGIGVPAAPGPAVPPPDDCAALPLVPGLTPTFLGNLEVRIARGAPFAGTGSPDMLWWARHRDPAARATEAGLVALLDTLPPAAATLMTRPAPLSSLTWMVDLPSGDITTEDGWYLLSSRADYAGGGFSGQAMAAWSRSGRLVAMHRQSVAIFA